MRSAGRALGNAVMATRGAALVITIQGELGAGKTTLVSGVLGAIGIPGPTRSPTYTLIEPYEAAQLQIYHLDLYRLIDAREVESLGIRDLLTADAVLLIEWPERGAAVLPPADLEISITYNGSLSGEGREMALASATAGGQLLLQRLRHVVK
jgi:tRNA threonylcarbamoyladenosine biosynthesis protein TsaE